MVDPAWIFGAVVALVFGSFLLRIIQKGGFRAAMFGARLRRTLGEVPLAQRSLMRTTLRIHTLEASSDGPAIGLELVTKSVASYHMMPIAMTIEQASQLNAFHTQAIAESRG